MEEYKDIRGYEGKYRVSNTGKIYSTHSGKVLKPQQELWIPPSDAVEKQHGQTPLCASTGGTGICR